MTEQPPIQPTPVGALRFNVDTARLEYFNGSEYVNITIDSPETNTGGTRGVTNGINENPQWQEHMDFFNIATTGNGTDFGNLSADIFATGSTASSTRGVVFGGYGGSPHSANSDEIQFVTIASQGNATDFGNLLGQYYSNPGASSETRGLWMGGTTNATSVSGSQDVIQYVTIASTGDAVDFGDMIAAISTSATFNSQTRAIAAGGYETPVTSNRIQYITTSTLGNSTDFGDLSTAAGFNNSMQGCNAVRAVMALGYIAPSNSSVNTVEYFQMATLGNSLDFGDVSTASEFLTAASSPTRCVWHINAGGGGDGDKMEYVEIMTTGNGIDFGDCTERQRTAGCSNGHGGL